MRNPATQPSAFDLNAALLGVYADDFTRWDQLHDPFFMFVFFQP